MSEFTIRDLAPDDAAALSDLFVRCYGHTYGSPVFYDVPALRTLIQEGALRSVVVGDDTGLVGHTGITIRHAHALVCETGNTVVDPRSRGQGLLRKLGGALRRRVIREGFSGYVHYPTTAHDIMQRASVNGGGVETGVMLAYVGQTTEYKAIDRKAADRGAGRLAATVAYQPFSEVPAREVVLPEKYRDLLTGMYTHAGLERAVASGVHSCGSLQPTELTCAKHRERGLLSIVLSRTGRDLVPRVNALVREHAPVVTHADLPLDDPHIDTAVEGLNALGFFFCALLPEFARTDMLRLQNLHAPEPGDFAPHVINEQARVFCEIMRRDARGQYSP